MRSDPRRRGHLEPAAPLGAAAVRPRAHYLCRHVPPVPRDPAAAAQARGAPTSETRTFLQIELPRLCACRVILQGGARGVERANVCLCAPQDKYGFKARVYQAKGFDTKEDYQKVHGSDLYITDTDKYDQICKARALSALLFIKVLTGPWKQHFTSACMTSSRVAEWV